MKSIIKNRIIGITSSFVFLSSMIAPISIKADPIFGDPDYVDPEPEYQTNSSNPDMTDAQIFSDQVNNAAQIQNINEGVSENLSALQDTMNTANEALGSFTGSPDLALDSVELNSMNENIVKADQFNQSLYDDSQDQQQRYEKDLDSLAGRLANAVGARTIGDAIKYMGGHEPKSSPTSTGAIFANWLGIENGYKADYLPFTAPKYDENGKRIQEDSRLGQAIQEQDLACVALDLLGHDRYTAKDEMNNFEKACRYGTNDAVSFFNYLIGRRDDDKVKNGEAGLLGYISRGYTVADYVNDKKNGEYGNHDKLSGGGKSNESKESSK